MKERILSIINNDFIMIGTMFLFIGWMVFDGINQNVLVAVACFAGFETYSILDKKSSSSVTNFVLSIARIIVVTATLFLFKNFFII